MGVLQQEMTVKVSHYTPGAANPYKLQMKSY